MKMIEGPKIPRKKQINRKQLIRKTFLDFFHSKTHTILQAQAIQKIRPHF